MKTLAAVLSILILFPPGAYAQYVPPERTSTNHTIVFIAHEGMRPGSPLCVGAFSNCYGVSEFQDRHFAVTVWGRDQFGPGMRAGDTFEYRATDERHGEFRLVADYESGPESYQDNGITIVNRLLPDNDDFLAALDSLSNLVQALIGEVESLEITVQNQIGDIGRLETELAEALEIVAPLQAEVADLRTLRDELRDSVEALTAANVALQNELQPIREERDRLTELRDTALARIRAEIERLRARQQ